MNHLLHRSSYSLRSTDCVPVKVISEDKSKLLHFQHLQYGNSCFISTFFWKQVWLVSAFRGDLAGVASFLLCLLLIQKNSNFISDLHCFQPKLYIRNFIWTGEDTCQVFLAYSESYFYSSTVQMIASALIKHNQNILF